jgi:hypothetical protein
VEYDTSPTTVTTSTIPDQPFALLGDGFVCDSPPLLPVAGSGVQTVEDMSNARAGTSTDKPVPIGLGLPASVSAPLLHLSAGDDSRIGRVQAHLASPPSPRTRRRSQALGNELVTLPAHSSLSAISGGLAAGATIDPMSSHTETVRKSPARASGKSAGGGWSDTDDDADMSGEY